MKKFPKNINNPIPEPFEPKNTNSKGGIDFSKGVDRLKETPTVTNPKKTRGLKYN